MAEIVVRKGSARLSAEPVSNEEIAEGDPSIIIAPSGMLSGGPSVEYLRLLADDPKNEPLVRWRSHANLLFTNWLNYFVYQETPYDLTKIH